MAGIVYIVVYVKMEANVIRVMDIVFVCRDLLVVDVNPCVHKARSDICVYKSVNVELTIFVILEQVITEKNQVK